MLRLAYGFMVASCVLLWATVALAHVVAEEKVTFDEVFRFARQYATPPASIRTPAAGVWTGVWRMRFSTWSSGSSYRAAEHYAAKVMMMDIDEQVGRQAIAGLLGYALLQLVVVNAASSTNRVTSVTVQDVSARN